MKKRILILALLSLSSLCRAEDIPSVSLPSATIIVLPDTFSEGDPQKISIQSDTSDSKTAERNQDWQALRSQSVEDLTTTGLSRSAKFEDLFSVVTYDFATVIQMKTPRVETILERRILADRYLARLNMLAQRWPERFSKIIIAGIGRGADVGHTIMEMSDTERSTQNPWLKNIQGLVSLGDSRRLVKLLGIVEDNGQGALNSTPAPHQNIAMALKYLDSNMRVLTKGLINIHNGLQPGEKLDRKRVSKIYTYYMLSLLGFMEELAKLQSVQATQSAIKVATLTSDIIQDPAFTGKLLSFFQLWMSKPDQDMAFFLIREVTGPSVAQKISDLSDLFSEGKTYKELPMVGRIYFRALKEALSQNGANFTQSLNASTDIEDPSRFLNSFNKHITDLGASISDLNKGLLDIGQSFETKNETVLHVEFENQNAPKLDKNIFIKVINTVSGSAVKETRAGL